MKLKIDVYYRDKKSGAFEIFHETIDEDDFIKIVKERCDNSKPMWMGEDWKFDSISVDKVEL